MLKIDWIMMFSYFWTGKMAWRLQGQRGQTCEHPRLIEEDTRAWFHPDGWQRTPYVHQGNCEEKPMDGAPTQRLETEMRSKIMIELEFPSHELLSWFSVLNKLHTQFSIDCPHMESLLHTGKSYRQWYTTYFSEWLPVLLTGAIFY